MPEATPGVEPAPPGATEYSFLDAFLEASAPASFDCVELTVEGICLYLVIRCRPSLTGLDCSDSGVEFSVELSHYNPDLLLASYTKLGASPLDAAKLLYAGVQTGITAPLLSLVTGQPVPRAYANDALWGGIGAERMESTHKSTLRYHEVDAIGHPGNALKLLDTLGSVASAGRAGDSSAVASAPGDDSAREDAQLQGAVLEELSGAPATALAGVRDQVGRLPATIRRAADDITRFEDPIRGIAGWETHPLEISLVGMANNRFVTDLASTAGAVAGLGGELERVADVASAAGAADYETLLAGFEEALGDVGVAQFAGVVDLITEIETIAEPFADLTTGKGGGTELFQFCPSDTTPAAPYLLSGLDLFQWRFNIPELVFPETYAIPGLSPERLFVANPPGNYWGTVYPRTGYVALADPMKAAANAAFRAGHVVTRAGQHHLYRPVPKRSTKDLTVEHPAPLEPQDPRTGRWQLNAPAADPACVRFGDGDFADGSSSVPWTAGKRSPDHRYVWTLWRKYTCCPNPKRRGEVVFVERSIGRIPIGIRVL